MNGFTFINLNMDIAGRHRYRWEINIQYLNEYYGNKGL
jgi:hypothetical protein